MDRQVSAFTLVELLVSIAVIAILAAIAYPAYVSQVIKGNRAAAQQFMLDIANAVHHVDPVGGDDAARRDDVWTVAQPSADRAQRSI